MELLNNYFRVNQLRDKWLCAIERVSQSLKTWLVAVSKSLPDILFKISLFKVALSFAGLLTMLTLFLINAHILDPITSQFSDWVSSSIVAFTISIIVVKFVVVLFCLRTMLAGNNRVESALAGVAGLRSALFRKRFNFHLRFTK